jgi:hypothetical protein
MVDNILITMIATDIAYAYLHIICFTTTYETDELMMIQTNNEISAEDIVCIFLYCLTNFALTGIFRVLMVFVDWKPGKDSKEKKNKKDNNDDNNNNNGGFLEPLI